MTNDKAIEYLDDVRNGIHIPAPGIELPLLNDKEKEAVDLAISALKKLEQDRWISVTERLPEYGTLVITQLSDNDIVTNWVIDEEDEEWLEDGVVAWRPLPELYEGL